ncbi:MAG: hypothetical protein LBH81_02180 [Rickettsiales bacterium]|nr:hypothetical protein [Rickettsiales bacterium]
MTKKCKPNFSFSVKIAHYTSKNHPSRQHARPDAGRFFSVLDDLSSKTRLR